ncbi:MAG: acetyltransferase [Clostridia bacterium]|jgi:GNAT superfamily N-acetyltransferase|nr:acetyltransferase [Clostridia bacterium]
MIIRKMTIEDIPELTDLYKQFWGEESNIEKMVKKFSELQKSDTHILLSAIEENHLIGTVTGIVCEELYGDCRPFLVVEDMIVDKSNRKQGVGKALFSELEKLAKNKNCTQIILVTETERTDACGFYEAMGFHPTANRGYKKKLY